MKADTTAYASIEQRSRSSPVVLTQRANSNSAFGFCSPAAITRLRDNCKASVSVPKHSGFTEPSRPGASERERTSQTLHKI